jgi:flagellar biosynthesis anti-sigma factor FlgM
MRIDAALPLPENIQTQNITRSGSSAPQGSVSPAVSSQDQAQLSVDSVTVQQMKTSLSQLPEIRQERVNALRQAVNGGSYQVSDQQLADAIGSDPLSSGQLRLT